MIYSVENSVISERGGSCRLRSMGGGGGGWSSVTLLDLLGHVG